MMVDEQYRHECECRHWVKVYREKLQESKDSANAWRDDFFKQIRKIRGKAAEKKLREGMRKLWQVE